MRRLLALALLTSTPWASTAHAQPEAHCLDRADTVGELLDMGGWIDAAGKSSNGYDVEWWTVPDGRWLLLIVQNKTEVCVLDIGDEARLAPHPNRSHDQ